MVPRYAAWLHVITGLPHGVGFLVDLRADLLAQRNQDPALGMLDDELTGHLSTLFDVGLLGLRQITWDSPASVLERLMATEAVHAIAGWDDLRHRLDGDLRCYGFFHPALEHEPIVFVEIALTHGLADHLPQLLNRADAVDDPDTAIFYSITSAQPGLAGVHLGNELIKQVVDALRHENDHLKTFATLSPLPGFRAWFVTQVEQGALTAAEEEALGPDAGAIAGLTDRTWIDDPTRAEQVRPGLLSARRALPRHPARRPGARSGRELPPVERRVARTAQLDGEPGVVRHRGVARAHGQLPLRPGQDRGQRRGVPRRRCDQHLVAGAQPGQDDQALILPVAVRAGSGPSFSDE